MDGPTVEQEVRPEKFELGKWNRPFRTLPASATVQAELVSSHRMGDKGAIHIALDNIEPPANLKAAQERKMLTVIIDGPKGANFLVQARLAHIPDVVYQADVEKIDGEVTYKNWRRVTTDPRTKRTTLSSQNPFTLLSLDASRLEVLIANRKKQTIDNRNPWQ